MATQGGAHPIQAGRDDTVHESGSYDNYQLSQPGSTGWPVPSDPQAVPHPRTGTGFAVGPTMPIPAVPQAADERPALSAGEHYVGGSYSAEEIATPDSHRTAPSPRPHVPAGTPDTGSVAGAGVSRETEDPPLAQ